MLEKVDVVRHPHSTPTPEFPAVENTGSPQPSIPAAAPEASPPFKYASRWDAATPDSDPATPVAIRKPGLQHDSGSPARAATSTCMAGDDRNTAVVPNTGGPLPNEAFAKIHRGTTSAHGFPESTRAGYERESSGGSMAHHSDLNSEVRGQLEALGAIKPTGPTGRQGPASGHLERLRSILGWATWAMVHAYTGWIAWRFWVQHENLSLGSGSCTDPVLLVIMLVATLSYSAFLVLQITGLWAPLVDTLVRVGNVIGDVMNRYACIKPFFVRNTNALYSAYRNSVQMPAPILRDPLFSATAPDALNYGGLGAIVGHEIMHAVLWTACFAALLARATLNSTAAMEGVICAAGQVVLVAGCCVYSRHPRSIRWTIPLSALLAHHLMALLFVHWGAGYKFLSCIEQLITR
ncbi:hypothetical protein HPB48_020723 [Haemaphysalis longicornis]|uniref:Uncharacterized protein n=1 Tax=Haemaphysalis longicornis TaxID=44386 RepID=A0A9J6G7N8_HAELO|nr:hypothetical protein HPB48_020723 [Haemaphysalis longicornis]